MNFLEGNGGKSEAGWGGEVGDGEGFSYSSALGLSPIVGFRAGFCAESWKYIRGAEMVRPQGQWLSGLMKVGEGWAQTGVRWAGVGEKSQDEQIIGLYSFRGGRCSWINMDRDRERVSWKRPRCFHPVGDNQCWWYLCAQRIDLGRLWRSQYSSLLIL